MKSIKTYPNIFWLIINLTILSFFGMMILVCLEWIFEFNHFFINSRDGKFVMFLLLLFASSFFAALYYKLSNEFTFAILNSEKIKIFQLLKFKILTLKYNEIKGYSNSEIYYGRVPLHFVSKSIIIYSEKNQFELIKLFNFNFEIFKNEMKKLKITYFGKEPYQTGIFKRKYKYKN
ncbi:hypothetical protein [Flavobacterium sp. N2820]|uniref:hypothetical protein n=1 Tax=Flavobacterium sp. N2820 TaxID=2986834 RepID=UPI0022258CF6|nr:hypothetical protein [Flavobacterium sp. N2820]